MSDPTHLGDLQLAIMRVLWARGEATTAQVHAALHEERGLAPTTISTMLRKMEDKGVVHHRVDGRQFVYRAAVEEGAIRRDMVGRLVERLFRGDPTALVSHLLTEGEIDAADLARLREKVAAGERRRARGGRGRA